MPVFPPLHIAATVLAGLYLPTAHLAPEKLVTMTRQISSRRRDRLLLRSRQIRGVRAAVWRACRPSP